MISVIIPTLNEAAHLGKTLELVRANTAPHEIIVVDGGSSDATVERACEQGATVLRAGKAGRAAQMNLGAQNARGDILFFLHADTLVRHSSLNQIEMALCHPAVIGGGFIRRFDAPSPFLKMTSWLASWRCRCLGWFLGDQGIFVRHAAFQQLNGFKPMDVFEDLDFSRRLARLGKVVTLSPGLISSARRFTEHGAIRTTCRDFWRTCCYLADPKAI